MRRLLSLPLLLAVGSCDSAEPTATTTPSAPTLPSAAAPAVEATPKQSVELAAEDGAKLVGDLYWAGVDAPAVVFIHRMSADRSEFSPLIERLRKSEPRMSLLAFDLRGHGASPPPSDKQKRDAPGYDEDVRAAIAAIVERAKDKPARVILVGSSYGATLVARVTFVAPEVVALALISPGAAISGLDLYEPYAEVRNLPTFLAGAVQDNVAKDPLDALAKMNPKAEVKRYPGSRHSAGHLGEEHAALWTDLQAWLSSVHDAARVERRSLRYAPGKEPKAGQRAGAERSR